MRDLPGKLGIRRHQPDDASALYSAIRESIQTLGPWLPWCTDRYSREDATRFIDACRHEWETERAYPFAIVDRETNELLGGVGISQINTVHQFGNIGYWVRQTRTGAGVATQAVRQVAAFGFGDLRLHRLEIVTRWENTASRRVAEKSGAQFESRARNRLFEGGKLYIGAIYSLTPDDLDIALSADRMPPV